MHAPRRPHPVPPAGPRLIAAAAAAAVALLASCVASTPTLGPSASPSTSNGAAVTPSPGGTPRSTPGASEPSPTSTGGIPTAPPSSTPTGSPVAFDPPWVSAGAMLGQHYYRDFEAVALADGRVLAIDGTWDPEGPTAPRAEIWDPATNGWSATPGLGRQRSAFAMVALQDGRALVAGGLNEGGHQRGLSYSSACVFDPHALADGCTKVGLMKMARAAPGAAVLPDGRVLVVGGYVNTGYEQAVAPPPDAAGVIALAGYRPGQPGDPSRSPLDDAVETAHGYALATAELFDPATGGWTATGPMRYARVAPSIVTLSDGRILVVGSSDDAVVGIHPDAYVTAEVYDPKSGRFSLAGRLPAIDHGAVRALGVTLPGDEGDSYATGTLVAVPGGDALLVGYDRWWKHQAEIVRTIRYDAGANTWQMVGKPCASAADASMQWSVTPGDCRSGELVVGLSSGHALALGGWPMAGEAPSPATGIASARLLDPATGRWTALPPTPLGREGGAAVALRDGSVMVFGGLGSDGEPLLAAVRYAP